MKVAFLTIGTERRGSTRLRAFQYRTPLADLGITTRFLAWRGRRSPSARAAYVGRALLLARWADVIVLQKPHQPRRLLDLLARVNRDLVVDFDDALWAPLVPGDAREEELARIRERRLRYAVEHSRLTICGSEHLAGWARRHAPGDDRVAVLPTPVDLARYGSVKEHVDVDVPRIGWIGSPVNLRDLDVVVPALRDLSATTRVAVEIVSREPSALPDVPGVCFRRWSADTEREALLSLDVGIMPMHDDERSRGRCGFKAVQYMAGGLPVVASRVGSTEEVVVDGETGFVVTGHDAWRDALDLLAGDTGLRATMGAAGRKRVDERFALDGNARRLANLLRAR